jgi:hypothetical protein
MQSRPPDGTPLAPPSPRPRAARRARMVAAGILLAAVVAACGSDSQTPEARVRATLAALEEAAEAGDVGALEEHVSERYEDAYGHDRQALGAFLAFQVMRHGSRHLLVRVRDVDLRDDGRATVRLHAGLAGTGGAAALSADVYEVEMDLLEEDGDWRLIWAAWKPAPAGALL